MFLRRGVLALLALVIAFPAIALAGPISLELAAGIQGFVPQGDGLADVYSFGVGPDVEADVHLPGPLRLALTAAPTYGFGDPVSGPLAADAGSTLWSVPVLGTLQFMFLPGRPFTPYAGAGGGFHYVRETLSFTSGIGERSETRSWTEFGWQVMAGIEQNKPARFFGELWLLKASQGGVDGGNFDRQLGGVQIRVGYRRAF